MGGTATQPILTFKDASNVTVATLALNVNGNDVLDVVHRAPVSAIVTDTLLTSDVTASGTELIKYIVSTISDLRVKITASDGDSTANENDDRVNPSTQGWGVSNSTINESESIKFEFIDQSDFPTVTSKPVQSFSFVTDDFTGNENRFDIQVKVTYASGHIPATETFSLSVTDGQTVSVTGLSGFDTGTLIQVVEIKHVEDTSNGFRLNNVKVSAESITPPFDLDYNFTLKFTDQDGDLVSQAFKLHLDGEKPLSSPGYSIDGPIAGATVYQDENNNALHDLSESFSITDDKGAYRLSIIDMNLDGVIDSKDGRLVSIGGQDIETHLQYDIPLFAPLSSEIISPFTSLLTMQMSSNEGIDLQLLNQDLVEALGLSAGTNLTKLNPINAVYNEGDISSLAKAAAIMTLSVQLSEAFGHKLGVSELNVADEVYKAIGDQLLNLPKGTVADFTDTGFLHDVVNNASQQLGLNAKDFDPIMNLLTESQIAIHNVADPIAPKQDYVAAISEVQHNTQGEYAETIGKFYSGEISENQLNSLTASVHNQNQGLSENGQGQSTLAAADVLSHSAQDANAALAALNEPSSSSPSSTNTSSTNNTTETTQPLSAPISIDSTGLDHPPQNHDL